MPKYFVFTQVDSNVPASSLFYSMQVYRDVGGERFYALAPTDPLPRPYPLLADYMTKRHETVDIPEDKASHFIMEVMLYRKTNNGYVPVLNNPATSIYSLAQFTTEEDQTSRNSRGSVCYFETTQQIKKVENNAVNTYALKISCKERMFIAPEHPVGDPLDPFTKDKVENQLKIRVVGPSGNVSVEEQLLADRILYYPNQDRTMLCGPAAFYYCMLKARPDLYQQAIMDLWDIGKTTIGSLTIKPSSNTRHPKNFFRSSEEPKIPAIDWISLASLRDSENTVLSYDSPDDKTSAITMWGVLSQWFEKVGATKSFDNISISTSNLYDICELNRRVGPESHVVTLISAGMLQLGAESPFKDHWVVWEGKVCLAKDGSEITPNTSLSEIVSLEMFSWGMVKQWLKPTLTLEQFLKHTFGGMVFNKIP